MIDLRAAWAVATTMVQVLLELPKVYFMCRRRYPYRGYPMSPLRPQQPPTQSPRVWLVFHLFQAVTLSWTAALRVVGTYAPHILPTALLVLFKDDRFATVLSYMHYAFSFIAWINVWRLGDNKWQVGLAVNGSLLVGIAVAQYLQYPFAYYFILTLASWLTATATVFAPLKRIVMGQSMDKNKSHKLG